MGTGPMHRAVEFSANLKMSKARNVFLHPEQIMKHANMMKHQKIPSLFLCQGCLFNAKVSIESHKAPADVRDNFTCNSDQYFDRIPCQCENDVHGQSMRKIRF